MTPGRLWAALLLRLYPRSFRESWGAELERTLDEQLRAREGERLLVRGGLWAKTTWGMLRGAAAEWRDELRGGGGTMTGWSVDVRQATRRLVRRPVFSLVAIATLGVGSGAFGAVWIAVESVLLEPMPYEDPEELSWVWRDYLWFDIHRGWLGSLEVLELGESEAVEAIVALQSGRDNLVVPGGEPTDVRFTAVSAGFFDVIGVPPALGRGFAEGEDAPGAPGVAVLGHPLWVSAFGADPSAVGRTIELDGETFEIVGVAPEGFDFVKHSSLGEPVPADLYVPLREDLVNADPGGGWLAGLVRWRDDATPAEREATLTRTAERLVEVLELPEDKRIRLWEAPLKEDLVADVRAPMVAILAAAGLLLLILAANLAILLIARFAERTRDTAVRAALGAGSGGIVRWIATELAVLGVGGAVLAVTVAAWGAKGLSIAAADALPRTAEIAMDPTSATLVVALVAAVVLLAGVAPLLRAVRLRPGPALRSGARGGDTPGIVRSRGALVAAQVGLSLVLLVGTGLLARSFASMLRTDPGFDAGETLTFRVAPDEAGYPEAPELLAFMDRLRDELGALPGVEAVGFTDALPLGQETNQTSVGFVGIESVPGDGEAPLADIFRVSSGYFDAVGLRVLAGRAFRADEGGEGARVVVVDDVLARRYFPEDGGRSAVGRRMPFAGDTATVVGVIDQARFYDVHLDDRGQVYVPTSWQVTRGIRVAVRTAGDAEALMAPVAATLRAVDPALPVSEMRTLRETVSASLRPERLNLWIVGAFALGAVTLVTLAIFGVVSGLVARRRAEIGVRMAIGADAGRVVKLVLLQGLRPVAMGAGAGLVGAWFLARFMSGLLFGVEARDPVTYAAVAVLLLAVAGLAAAVPARRAATLPPSEALRAE